MATATAPTPTPSAVSISSEVKTFGRLIFVSGKEKEGQEELTTRIIPSKTIEAIQESEKEGAFYYEDKGKQFVVKSLEAQDFIQRFASTIEGWKELIPDEGELCAMATRGASQKLDNKAKQWLSATVTVTNEQGQEELTFENQVTEGAYDQSEMLKEITNRRLSAQEKLFNDVNNVALTPEAFDRLFAALQARRAELGM